ncbi:MAG: phenylalanine--tRNA ligase subunit beta, partial [Bacillota bacterium]|nr:phenylalanine--tRNA ligase subunit beta [Bacillota bacterium]
EKNQGGLKVTIPFYRQDITREVDLIEEVARLYGYDKIPTTLPVGQLTEGKKSFSQKMQDKAKNTLTGIGFGEIITYSFTNKKNYDLLSLAEDDKRRESVVVMNPFSDEQGVMRTTLLPAILTVASRNMNRKNVNLALFEMAHVFKPVAGEMLPEENINLVALVSGELTQGWTGKSQAMDLFYMKGVVAALMAKLGVDNWQVEKGTPEPFLHPGRSCYITVDGDILGYLGEIHPVVQENYDMPERAVVFELDLDKLITYNGSLKRYEAVSKYPGVEVDLALVCDRALNAGDIEAVVRGSAGEYLESLELFDIYQGERILSTQKSLAYRLKFQTPERTLTAEEVNAAVDNVIKELKERLGVELRS